MGIEQMSKEELIKIWKDKQEVLTLLSEKRQAQIVSYMTPDFTRSLENARCRSCVGRIYEELRPIPGDPEGKTKKVVLHEGAPYTIEHGGNELACRTCKHVRQGMVDAGLSGIHI